MSNNEFFKMSILTISEIGSKIDMNNLQDPDNEKIFDDIQNLTHDLLAAYGYKMFKEETENNKMKGVHYTEINRTKINYN